MKDHYHLIRLSIIPCLLFLFTIFSNLAKAQLAKDTLLAQLDRAADFSDYSQISESIQALDAAQAPLLAKADHQYRLHAFHCRQDHAIATEPLKSFLDGYQGGLADSSVWLHYMHLAYHYQKQQLYYDAMPYYEWVVDYADDHDIAPYNIIRHILMPLGNIYTRLREYEKGEATFRRVIRLAEAEGSLIRNVTNYGNLGLVYATKGDFESAVKSYNTGLAVPKIKPLDRIFLLQCRALSFQETGFTQEALADAEEALILLQNETSASSRTLAYQATFLQLRGEIALEQENYAAAMNSLMQSRQIHLSTYQEGAINRDLARIEISLAQVYQGQQNFPEALKALDRAMVYVGPGFRPKEALSIPLPAALYTDHAAMEVLDAKGELFHQLSETDQKQKEQAIRALLLAQMVEDRIRNTLVSPIAFYSLQARSRQRTEFLIAWCYELYQASGKETYLQLAFQQVERSKARLLTETLLNRQIQSEKGIDSLSQTRARLQEQLASLENDLQYYTHSAEKENTELIQKLKEEKLDLQTQLQSFFNIASTEEILPDFGPAQHKDIADIVVQLGSDQVLLSYFIGEKNSYVFRLDQKGSIQLFALQPAQNLAAFLALWQDQKRWQLDRATYTRLAYATFQDWLAPAYQPDDKHLIIIPDGALGYLPFDLLLTEENNSAPWGGLPYLLRNTIVQQVYSGRLWLQQLEQRSLKGKNLLIAPVFDSNQPEPIAMLETEMGPDLARLPIDSLRVAQDPGWHRLTRDQATKAAFLAEAKDANLIHLFTHADIGSQDALPWIHFTDQPLYFSELNHLRLPADLIILSACETHLGRVEKGEGVLSLSHGFTQAGSASQIASLWRVKALATAQLFNQFYIELGQGKTKAAALRAAKLHYLSHAPDIQRSPAYWGGFVFSGADGLLQVQSSSFSLPTWTYLLLLTSILITIIIWRKPKKLK